MRRLSIHLDAANTGVSHVVQKAHYQSEKVYLTHAILQNFVLMHLDVSFGGCMVLCILPVNRNQGLKKRVRLDRVCHFNSVRGLACKIRGLFVMLIL